MACASAQKDFQASEKRSLKPRAVEVTEEVTSGFWGKGDEDGFWDANTGGRFLQKWRENCGPPQSVIFLQVSQEKAKPLRIETYKK